MNTRLMRSRRNECRSQTAAAVTTRRPAVSGLAAAIPARAMAAAIHTRIRPLRLSLRGRPPSGFRKMEHSVGTMTSATKSELVSVMMSVSGRYFMNSPSVPGQNSSGVNAASVVAVAAITGTATSPVAFLHASRRVHPSSMKR